MSPVTHQTIKLSKGKHASPGDGACVMELASMLAAEPFSDHPAVCPVIGLLAIGAPAQPAVPDLALDLPPALYPVA
jgi:hypothetical protein